MPQSRWFVQTPQCSSFNEYLSGTNSTPGAGQRRWAGLSLCLRGVPLVPTGSWNVGFQGEVSDGQQGRARETRLWHLLLFQLHLSLVREEDSGKVILQGEGLCTGVRGVTLERGWRWKSLWLWNVVFWGQYIESWLLTTSHKTVIFGVAS